MKPFTIWVDADSCPVSVREIIIRFAKRLDIKAIFVANREIPLPKLHCLGIVITENTADAADNYIVEHSVSKDFAITRDVPLAARLVEKGLVVISDRGTLYTPDNIREVLSFRNFNLELIQNGIPELKTNAYSKKDLSEFANLFDRELTKLLKRL